MSKISFHVELDNRVKKDGTQNIQIRITQAKKMLRVSVGASVEKKYWNDEKKEVRKRHPHCPQINTSIKAKLLERETTYLKGQFGTKKVTASTLQKQLKKEIVGESFLEYSRTRASKIPNPSTKSTTIAILNKLEVYLKGKDLLFPEIDYDWIKDYERYLVKLGNVTNTVHNNLEILKACYNDAIRSGVFEPEKMSPWMRYKGKKAKTSRTRLTEAQISQLERLDLRPGTNKFHARNFFLFAFYMQGMRVSDVLQLRWSNIVNERLDYTAGKTQKSRSKKIIKRAGDILNLYRKPKQKHTDFIFPFLKDLKKSQFTPEAWRKKIEAATSVINIDLLSKTRF
ncbi:site-specific integrase [Runella sp.]|uniref:site-specific integrase n=1 Tax=Runella sp. TaxID=1960881 RepID=UPI00301AFF0A